MLHTSLAFCHDSALAMTRILPRASGLLLSVLALGAPLAAQKGVSEPRIGLEVKPPKGWVELPGNVDRGATIRLFAAPRALAGKTEATHTPILRAMFFAAGGDASKDVVDGLPRMTSFRSLEDFATRGLGVKDAKKEQDKAGTLTFTSITGTHGDFTFHGAAFVFDGGEAAVCFDCFTSQYDKLKKEFDASIGGTTAVARVAAARPEAPWDSDKDWATKDAPTRNGMRKAWITAVVDAATKEPSTSFKPGKSKHWTVLSSADAGFTKKAVAAAEAMRAWMSQKLPELVKDAPQPAVLRIFGSMDHYNAYLTTVTETREYDQKRRELHFVNDPDNGGSGGYGMLFRAVMWHAFDDLDDGILPAMPRWFDNGIWEFLRSSQCDGKKVEFTASDVEKGRISYYSQNNQEIPATWHLIQEAIQKSPEDGKNEDPWGYTPECSRMIRWWLMHDGGKAFEKPNLFVDYVRAVGQAHVRMGADPMLDVGGPSLTDDENKKRNKAQYKWRDDLLGQVNTIVIPLDEAKWKAANEKWLAFNQSGK
ncbi:MAG: hypothetical protein RIT24_180 [Planctomycetota bacterium]